MRSVVASLAETTNRTVPDFTDHTVRHMDALWRVADQVLTQAEIATLTPAEAFILCSGFYLHDIGMAYAATEEGVKRIKESNAYNGFIAAVPESARGDPRIESRAIAAAVRHLHAGAAKELAIHEVPGSGGRFLIEAQSFREAWGATCGEVASSHHWSLSTLDATFGHQGDVPLPGNRRGDLLYVAACLPLIDYAHINRDRALSIDRAFRFPLIAESLVHWLAQEHIDGPARVDNELVYRAAMPIADVEAWWLYYEMLSGLDREIRGVKRLLDQRKEASKRISLNGVRGATSPEEAATYIPTSGFLPIEVNLRTGSIDRLIELLAGETLYGPNPMAAVRELIQNARDAVMLKAEVATHEADKATLLIPIRVSLNTKSHPPTLEIVDHGVGMTKKVITDFLITIASNYWTSQFAIDFPAAAQRGFKSAGKFGIGFLSVFMLGPDVTVESNRTGGERYQLSLRGAGRRGELRELPAPSGSGTAVRVKLGAAALDGITPLDELVRVYAPTLPHALTIDVDGRRTDLPTGWLKSMDAEAFKTWVLRAINIVREKSATRSGDRAQVLEEYYFYRRLHAVGNGDDETTWPGKRPEYSQENDRLVASFEGTSLLCLRGLAVQAVSTPGFIGVIDLDSAAPDISRSRAVSADLTRVLEAARGSVGPQIVENLNMLGRTGFLIDKAPFIASCVQLYGRQVILDSDVPWISRIKMPGNVELISSATLLSSLTDSNSVFVAYNTGPWTAMKRWARAEPSPGATEVAVLVDGKRQPGPGYRMSADGKKVGSLLNLWPKCTDSPLFGTLIRILAQAWQTSPDDLLRREGWTHETDEVYGRFYRP